MQLNMNDDQAISVYRLVDNIKLSTEDVNNICNVIGIPSDCVKYFRAGLESGTLDVKELSKELNTTINRGRAIAKMMLDRWLNRDEMMFVLAMGEVSFENMKLSLERRLNKDFNNDKKVKWVSVPGISTMTEPVAKSYWKLINNRRLHVSEISHIVGLPKLAVKDMESQLYLGLISVEQVAIENKLSIERAEMAIKLITKKNLNRIEMMTLLGMNNETLDRLREYLNNYFKRQH